MKPILLILILFIGLTSQATIYYVSATGSDSANGLTEGTAWQTLTKVNVQTFVAGDQILFKKGDGWYGVLNINQSGSVGNVIKFSTYGTGSTPTITGFTTISGWTDEGNGIYSKVITSDSQTNMVTIDGVEYGMGRYPNSTYLTYESFSTDVSITDTSLPSTPNWTGAELIKRPNDWSLERCLITNHSGNTITYTNDLSNATGVAGNGYFIQNDLRTLDQYGEWYHDYSGSGKFYMYFGAVNPSSKTVKVATKNYCVDVQGETYITIDGLQFTGAIKNTVNVSSASANLTVKNCTVSFAGTNGVFVNGTGSLIDYNSISYCNASAVRGGGSNSITVSNNTITNIGLIKGASESYYNAVMLSATTGHSILNNSIVNSGSNGIMVSGANITISNNFVNYSNLILNDGGGIYTSGPSNSNTLINNNIVLNSIGNTEGGDTQISISEGIYLDELSNSVTVSENTCALNGYSGIKLHKANTCTIQNNTLYGNNQCGIYILNSSTTASYLYSNVVSGNIIVSQNSSQSNIIFKDAYNSSYVFGTFTGNQYARPSSELFKTNVVGSGWLDKTLAQWKTFSSQDANATTAPFSFAEADLRLEYNSTNSTSTVTLSENYRDIQTNSDHTTYKLPAHSSVVLLKHAAYPSTATRKAGRYNGETLVYNGKILKM